MTLLRYFLLTYLSLLSFISFAKYPDKPIKLIVPLPAGSSPDIMARLIAEKLTKELGKPVIIENKSGAGGNIGTRFVAQAKNDGYTLLYTFNATISTAKSLYKNTLGYDPFKDFSPISLIATSPLALVVPKSLNVQNTNEFIDLVKKNQEKFNYGSVGLGSASHLGMEKLKDLAQLELEHIPYLGTPQAITAIMTNEVQASIMVPTIAIPQHKSGKAKVLAVTSKERSSFLLDIPSISETPFFKDVNITAWHAFLAPAGTNSETIKLLNQKMELILNSKEIKNQFAQHFFTPKYSTPEDVLKQMISEIKTWESTIEKLNLALD